METLNRSTNHSAIRTASALPGIRRSVRSSSAMAYPSTISRPTRSSTFNSRLAPCSNANGGRPHVEKFVNRNARYLLAAVAASVLLIGAPAATAQAADYKIGFVNTERLFRDAAPAERAQQKRERQFAARDAEIQKLAKQVRDLQALLEKDGITMAEAERRNRERDLANLSRDLTRSQREFREDLTLRRNEKFASVQDRANKVIQQIAEAEKFDLIIQDPVVYASQKIDITEKVIKALADKIARPPPSQRLRAHAPVRTRGPHRSYRGRRRQRRHRAHGNPRGRRPGRHRVPRQSEIPWL